MKNINEGLEMMLSDVSDMVVSRLYETEAFGFDSQPRFLNAAARFKTPMDPFTTLDCIKTIQKEISGERVFVNGPRSLDIDILLHGRGIIDLPHLVIPHPRMLERKFVLKPLAEIAPQLTHPITGETVRDCLRKLESHG